MYDPSKRLHKGLFSTPPPPHPPVAIAGVADGQVMDAGMWSNTKPPCNHQNQLALGIQ